MYQGLGQTYVEVFFWLSASGFMTAGLAVAIVRLITQMRLLWGVFATAFFGALLAHGANTLLHDDLFVRVHQSHNKLVPERHNFPLTIALFRQVAYLVA